MYYHQVPDFSPAESMARSTPGARRSPVLTKREKVHAVPLRCHQAGAAEGCVV